MKLVQELILLPLLAKSQAHYFVGFLNNRQENIIMVFSLQGPNAHFFGKDLQMRLSNWQFHSAEKLHLALLDLNKECRLKKLQLNFSLTLRTKKNIILACQGGSILLKRHQQLKQLISSQSEINMLIGQYMENDQFLLIAGDQQLGQVIIEKNRNHPLELIIEQKLNDYFKNNFNSVLLLWHYQDKEKISLSKKLTKIKTSFLKIKKIPKKIKEFVLKIKNLRQEQKKRYQKIFLLTALVIVLISTAFISWRYLEQRSLERVNNEINTLILSDEELEKLSTTQPVLARDKIQENRDQLKQLLLEYNSLLAKKRIEEKIQELENKTEQLASENNLDQLLVYSNWYENYPDFLGNKMIASPQGLLVGNGQSGQLLLINDNNNFAQWAINFSDFSVDSSNPERLKIFIKDQGIKYLDWQDKSSFELKTEGDSDRDAQLVESYQNFLYLLNPEKRNIYRYTLTDGELSEAIGWLVDKQNINFSEISDMSIDGDLWLSFKDGKIMKFSRGYQENFILTGLEELPNNSILIASQENSEKIVFLDSSNNRLIVSTKEGQLISEIKSNELAGVSDITLSSDGQSCFALSGSVIYQIQI
jgi:hypothetical protein